MRASVGRELTQSSCPLTLTGIRVPRDGRAMADVLDIYSVTFAAGEIVGLLGSSGAGKTMLRDVIAGLIVPSSGAVQWGDTIVSNLGETKRDLWRRAHFGFVFQSVQLVPELSARDNVWADLRAMRLGGIIAVGLIALAVAIAVAIGAQERALRQASARASDDFPLIIGAPGSARSLS